MPTYQLPAEKIDCSDEIARVLHAEHAEWMPQLVRNLAHRVVVAESLCEVYRQRCQRIEAERQAEHERHIARLRGSAA